LNRLEIPVSPGVLIICSIPHIRYRCTWVWDNTKRMQRLYCL